MNFPIPDFVPVPSAEIMQTIRGVSLIVGICLVGVGLLFQFLLKRNFLCNKKKGKEKKVIALWVVIGIGVLLIVNHGIQLFFKEEILCSCKGSRIFFRKTRRI